MSGETEFSTQLDRVLDEYNKIQISIPDNIETYLNLTRDQIESFSSSQALSASAIILQYAIHLQKQENRERARVSWCESHINSLCGIHWNKFDQYMPKDIKIAKIAEEYESVSKLIEIHRHSTARMNEIAGLTNIVRYYGNIFLEIGKRH